MSNYTRLGTSLWSWDPWVVLDPGPRLLWLGLYTTVEAKRVCPGLFHGSVLQMSEACRLSSHETLGALDTLIDRELVEYDPKLRVLRMVELPDAGESPANGKVIWSWWSKFKMVPSCAVRDSHVKTLRWILEQGARDAALNNPKRDPAPSQGHEEAWQETFGTVQIPIHRKRGARRLLDNSTGTDRQPGLFDPRPDPSEGSDTVSADHRLRAALGSVAESDTLQPYENTALDTVSDTVSIPIGSRIPDPGSSSSSPEGECRGGHDARMLDERPKLGPPVLYVVPPFLPQELCDALAGRPGTIIAEDSWVHLRQTIRVLERNGVGWAEIALVANWLRLDNNASRELHRMRGDPLERVSLWACDAGRILRALTAARDHDAMREDRSVMLRDAMASLGLKPPEGS